MCNILCLQTIKLTQTANSPFGIEAVQDGGCYDKLIIQDSSTTRTVCGTGGFEDNSATNSITVQFTSDSRYTHSK